MPNRPDKAALAAVIAAVANYIAIDESVRAPDETAPAANNGARTDGGAYAASGRQQLMDQRRRVSLRLLRP